jgi:very-short-patch-repair endonuclease
MNFLMILGPLMPFAYLGFAFVVVVGVAGLFLALKNGPVGDFDEYEKRKKLYVYRRKEYFMTKAERECYKALVQAVGNDYVVFAQVHLPTIIDEKIPGQDWRAARAHINRKSVDFVLCDKEYISPKLAIELDDWSHAREDRKERDTEVERLLDEAGMPLLRITDTTNLREKVIQATHGQEEV